MFNVVQFELWKKCGNCCSFCFNKGFGNEKTNPNMVVHAIEFIESSKINKYDAIGLIGGELFDNILDNEEISAKFFELLSKISKMLSAGKLQQLWLATALMFDDDKYLKTALDIFTNDNVIDKVLICTSYDTKGRFFANKEAKWHRNMQMLCADYPCLKLHTEIIITQDLVDNVLCDKFNIIEFSNKYKTHVDFLEPNCGFHFANKYEHAKLLPWFYPTRKSFMEFVNKLYVENQFDISVLLSPKMRSCTLYMDAGNGREEFIERDLKNTTLPCDINNKNGYIDSDIEMYQDVQVFLQLIKH